MKNKCSKLEAKKQKKIEEKILKNIKENGTASGRNMTIKLPLKSN